MGWTPYRQHERRHHLDLSFAFLSRSTAHQTAHASGGNGSGFCIQRLTSSHERLKWEEVSRWHLRRPNRQQADPHTTLSPFHSLNFFGGGIRKCMEESVVCGARRRTRRRGGGVRRHVLVRRRITTRSNRTKKYKATTRAERAKSIRVLAKIGSSGVQ